MNLFVIIGLIAVLIFLNTRKLPVLCWLFLWPLAVYLFVRYGFETYVPLSILQIYFWLTVAGVICYVYADDARYEQVSGQIRTFICDPSCKVPLYLVTVLLPLALALSIFLDVNAAVRVPTFGRTVHPSPPRSITVHGEQIDLITGKNPFRPLQESDPEAFAAHLENGKRVYYQNCVYCHGDDLAGDGRYAHALTPVPANFQSETILPQIQEAYLFWRIAKGGPGLPDEAGPWSSSMPAWESFLETEEMWDVVLFLYHYTGFEPRAEEEHH